jgi:hypothetical protein
MWGGGTSSLTEIHMLRLLCTTFVLLAIALTTTALAKQKTFSWVDGLCEISVRYDSSKVKTEQLQDTVYLLNEAYQNMFVSMGLVSTPEDIKNLDRESVQKQCAKNRDKLASLRFLKIPSLQGKLEPLQQELLKAQDALCAYQDIHMRGYETPSALREYKGAPQCDAFVDALEDDTKLETTWRDFVKTLCANNASVEDCSKRELAKAALPDAKDHMRITLTSFGWNNCTNPSVWGDSDGLQAKLQTAAEALQTHFKAKVACEEP